MYDSAQAYKDTGLLYARNRYSSPTLGVFVSQNNYGDFGIYLTAMPWVRAEVRLWIIRNAPVDSNYVDGFSLYLAAYAMFQGLDPSGQPITSIDAAMKACFERCDYCKILRCLNDLIGTFNDAGEALPPGLQNAANAYEKWCQLPVGKGKVPFKPKKVKGKPGEVPKDKNGNPIDDKDRSWEWDARKKEWDVQDPSSPTGHWNVNSAGNITHGPSPK